MSFKINSYNDILINKYNDKRNSSISECQHSKVQQKNNFIPIENRTGLLPVLLSCQLESLLSLCWKMLRGSGIDTDFGDFFHSTALLWNEVSTIFGIIFLSFFLVLGL